MDVEPRSDAASLLARAAGGDVDAWGALLAQNEERPSGAWFPSGSTHGCAGGSMRPT